MHPAYFAWSDGAPWGATCPWGAAVQVACNTHVHLQMDEEFNQLLNGFAPVQHEEPALTFQASAAQKTPAEVDWRMRGYVTPVKNQVGTWGALSGAVGWVSAAEAGDCILQSGQNSVKPREAAPIVLAVEVSCSFADEELESNTVGSQHPPPSSFGVIL